MKYSALILLVIILISINGYSWVTIYQHVNKDDSPLTSEEKEVNTFNHLNENTESSASFFAAHKPLILLIVTCYISFVVTFLLMILRLGCFPYIVMGLAVFISFAVSFLVGSMMNGHLITAFFIGSLLGLVTGIVLLRIYNEKEDEEELAFLYPSFRAIWTPLEAFGIYFEECNENGKLYMRIRAAKKIELFQIKRSDL